MNNDVQHDELEFEDADFVEASEGLTAPEINKDQGLKMQGRSLRIRDQEVKHRGRSGERSLLVSYVFLPVIFLTVALFGGVRVASDGSLVFLFPQHFLKFCIDIIWLQVTMPPSSCERQKHESTRAAFHFPPTGVRNRRRSRPGFEWRTRPGRRKGFDRR